MDDKLTEQSSITAEGVKQLVESTKRLVTLEEQIARFMGTPQSPAAREFASAAREIAGTQPQAPPISHAIQQGVAQIQAASQPRASEQRSTPSFDRISTAMQNAIARGGDPVFAARNPSAYVPLRENEWPRGMPPLPSGSPTQRDQPTPAEDDTSRPGRSLGSQLALGTAAGLGLAKLITGQTVGEFSAGHGLSQWNAEAAATSNYISSLPTMLRSGAEKLWGDASTAFTSGMKHISQVGASIPEKVLNQLGRVAGLGSAGVDFSNNNPARQLELKNNESLFDVFKRDMANADWSADILSPNIESDDLEHKRESGKTSVGDGPK